MKRKQLIPAAIGTCSLLVTLSIVCIAVFSVLSVSTAEAGKRLSEISARSTAEYYEADCKANEILALVRSGNIPDTVKEENGVYSFSVKQNYAVELFVEFEFSGEDCKILRWQSVRTADWEADDGIDLYDPFEDGSSE